MADVHLTSLVWESRIGGCASAPEHAEIPVGVAGRAWSGDELLLAALEASVLDAFLVVTHASGVAVTSYASSATTLAPPGNSGPIDLRVQVVVGREADRTIAARLLEHAVQSARVNRALKTAVVLDFTIAVGANAVPSSCPATVGVGALR